MALYSSRRPIINDNLLDIVKSSFNNIQSRNLQEIYRYVSDFLGGYICNITGNPMTKSGFEGRIRSLLEEHSADSRQHYIRGGKIQPNGWRMNIFANPSLRERNDNVSWERGRHVGGRKGQSIWYFQPGEGRPSPDQLSNLQRGSRQGMRGGGRAQNTETSKYSYIYNRVSYII